MWFFCRFTGLATMLFFVAVTVACSVHAGSGAVHRVANEGGRREIHVRKGDTVEVALLFNAGTGYAWDLNEGSNDFVRVADVVTQSGGDPRKTGGPVQTTWKLEVLKSGTTTLSFLLYRAWEGKSQAAERFELTIVSGE